MRRVDSIPYSALFGLHLLAVAIFLAGLIITALSLPSFTRSGALIRARHDEVLRLRSMNRFISSPALVFVWICGAGMALQAGWYVSGWLQGKMVLVGALSLLHVQQSRTLTHLANGHVTKAVGFRRFAIIVILVLCVGTLVIAKPDLPAL